MRNLQLSFFQIKVKAETRKQNCEIYKRLEYKRILVKAKCYT